MRIDEQGLLQPVRYVASPNCDERPPGCPVDLIVVHGISLPPGEFGGPWIEQLFTNDLRVDAHPYFTEIADLKVSAHVLIQRDGELIQFVPFSQRAWHAGVSCHEGRVACNDFSIGIELEGSDDLPYTDAQYDILARLIDLLCKHYPGLTPKRVVGHSDIAPGRKTDPGPSFDWQALHRRLSIA